MSVLLASRSRVQVGGRSRDDRAAPAALTAAGDIGTLLRLPLAAPPLLGEQALELLLFHLELGAERRDARLQRLAFEVQLAPPALDLLLPQQVVAAFARLLVPPGRAGEHPFRTEIDVDQLDAVIGEQELADLVRVAHAARIQDVSATVEFPR